MPYLHERMGPDITKLTEIQGEMTVQIPREYTPFFKDFFTDYDNDLEQLGLHQQRDLADHHGPFLHQVMVPLGEVVPVGRLIVTVVVLCLMMTSLILLRPNL